MHHELSAGIDAPQPNQPVAGAPGLTELDELMRRTALGDEAAFARLYDQMAARTYGLALRVVRDPAQSEEVAQETWIHVWRNAGRFDTRRGQAAAWILSLAHHRAVDRVRSEQAGTERKRHATPDLPAPDVSDEVTTRLEHQAVRRCLNSLTHLQREAITLAYYRGYTYREVADLVGAALPAVKSRMRDGLIRLRDCLGGQR